MTDSIEAADRRLLDAIQSFVADHPDPTIQHFHGSIADWGDRWVETPPRHLQAADTLTDCLALTAPETHDLTAAFDAEKSTRNWEQSYTSADNVVGDDMLAGYGFAEVIGKHGPFVSERVRAGIGVWGPHIDYPPHRHAAEEVYVVVAGSAEFELGEPVMRRAGEVVYVPSMLTHGFRTSDQPLAVFYIWQAGDLREKSSFN
ncbi:MAG: dimethylsulfonioproprionate lyase family protein [Paracoccaceae bacterium]|nr:dimethylsulfonioproprionate lyase family protein [Paracoccaceae bacterium]